MRCLILPETIMTKSTINKYLNELAKEYRKIAGRKAKAEILIIGGAAIILNHDFRPQSNDIDALYLDSAIKEAAIKVREKYHLRNDWFNSEFKKTSSFSHKLYQFARYYKTYYHALEVRILPDTYMIAMKLRAGRVYKNDLSDVLGLLMENQLNHNFIKLDDILSAYKDLYNTLDMPGESKDLLDIISSSENYKALYYEIKEEEEKNRKELVEFDKSYPETLKEDNLKQILDSLKSKKEDNR